MKRFGPRIFKRIGRRRQNFKWDRDIQPQQAVTVGNQLSVSLLDIGDYAGNAVFSPTGVTVQRLVLDFTVLTRQSSPSSGFAFWWWAIFAYDTDQSAPAPNLASNLTDERVIAAGTGASRETAGVGWISHGAHIHVDTKVKVRCRDTQMAFCIVNDAAGSLTVDVHGMWAILVSGDTT